MLWCWPWRFLGVELEENADMVMGRARGHGGGCNIVLGCPGELVVRGEVKGRSDGAGAVDIGGF